jgi:hypothetical protein
MIETKTLQFIHGLGGIILIDKGHKGNPTRLHRFPILGEIDATEIYSVE